MVFARSRLVRLAAASAVVVPCALGCKKAGPPAPAPDPMAIPSDVGEVRLPSSTSAAAPAEGFTVYVSRDFVFAGKPARKLFEVPHGADGARGFAPAHKRSGPHDLFLVPLADASPSGTGHAVVYLDRETPYRILTEVLFTLAQRSIPRFELATTGKDGRTKAVEVTAPKSCAPPAAQLQKMEEDMQAILFALGSASAAPSVRPPPPSSATPSATTKLPPCKENALSLTVLVVADGISIKARGGNMGPGCKDVGAGIAVPKSRSHAYDFASVTACVDRLKHVAPEFESEDEVTIAASPDVPFEAIVATMDATRATPDGGVLFPKVRLGLAR